MSILSQPLQLISFGPARSFNGISGYVTILENAVDKVTITKQPVQQGASIADHAFKDPVSFTTNLSFRDNQGLSLKDIYEQLLLVQNTFQTFQVITPKRNYSNMMIATLSQTTDKKTENCLAIQIGFEQILTVPVATTTVPRSQLKNPGSNGGTQNAGKKSAIKSLVGG